MHNQPEMKAVSVQLYKYLCDEIVGSEKVVRYKRLYCKLHDDLLNNSENAFIISGSMAEGLTLPGSDIDIMLLDKFCEVYENRPLHKEDVIILETENALPGFALLKKAEELEFPIKHNFDGTLIACIANSGILESQCDTEDDDDEFFEVHGPNWSSSLLHDIDMVICVKCQTWPTVSHKWLCRYRTSGWPSHGIIPNIVSHGVLLVPVGSKSLNSEGHPFEWRFSFSTSEKLLVYSFNHTQLPCYSLLKLFLKEVVDEDNILNKRLCS
ncbi:uncharacterized protein LOC134694118 [Mytilus trossulus]|uniref:uncharacterized protein LOC134694118 n=1 Tax=Mytilus trossulus TaxID=6551 RepID=UPI003004E825